MGKGRLGAVNGGRAAPDIKNKIKRQQVYHKLKREGGKAQRKARALRQKEAEALGEAAPAHVQRTLDNTREADDTMVQPGDEEVAAEDSFDEFSAHFSGDVPPRTLVTTGRYPSDKLLGFMEEMVTLLPNCEYRQRGAVPLKQLVDACNERGFTSLLVFTENKEKKPQSLWLVKLPYGPTARFKVSSLVLPKRIAGHGRPTAHRPELILNSFGTRLGHRLGRMLACLFPHDPQFRGRQVVTMHNQRDFVFFRHHRYIFEQKEERGQVSARLQELGPRFTLRLKSLQLGTFDTQHGEYEWKHKPELDTSRRRFHV